jgi:hypothetical protein
MPNLMFRRPCITVYRCTETDVMHFLFSLLRIKDLHVFRVLLAHPQEALHKRHLVYRLRVMSVVCTRIAEENSNPGAANLRNTPNILSAVCVAPP